MSAVEAAHPKIESTGDSLRIEFPEPRHWSVDLVLLLSMPIVYYLIARLFGGFKTSDLRSMVTLLPFWVFWIWRNRRQYTILLSQKGLAVRQQALGIRRTKFYPLAEIQNLHFSYNPVLGKPPKQWELMFDRYGLAHNIPILVTLPDAQNLKEAIYSRFPQLAPARPSVQQA